MPNNQYIYKEKLLELIMEYVACSKYVCSILEDLKGDQDTILRAVRLNKIPKEGYLEHGIYYNFHGVGCFLEWPNNRIEIDFGPKNRCDGFDIYKLQVFLYGKETKYAELMQRENLEIAFLSLISDKIIENPKWLPSEHLFYLKHT